MERLKKYPFMDRFEFIRELGMGSYGRALLVRHHDPEKLHNCQQHYFVIKQMRLPYLLSGLQTTQQREGHEQPDGVTWDQAKLVEMAYQEVRLLRSLNHPNIVRAFEAFEDSANNLNLVMEYCDGGDLNQAILAQQGAYFDESQIRSWFSQVTFAIKYLHDRHILHRDVKAANVFLVNQRRQVKLGDFGICKVLDKTGGLAMTQIGTPTYIAPELCDGLAYGEKAEVWSLGILLYNMSSLTLPFIENNLPALFIAIKSKAPIALPEQLSSELRCLCDRMLEKNPEQRPSVAEIVADDFLLSAVADLVARGTSITDQQPPSPPPVPPPFQPMTPQSPLNDSAVSTNSSASSNSVYSAASAPSVANTVSVRSTDGQNYERVEEPPTADSEDDLPKRIRGGGLQVEAVFREPIVAILKDQLLTAKTLVTLNDDDLKDMCGGKKGLQMALLKMVEQLRNEENKNSAESLRLAIDHSDCDALRRLAKTYQSQGISISGVVVDAETQNTAVHYACKVGAAEPLKLLLAMGADLTTRNKYEDQPLHVAAFSGRLLAVDILLRSKLVDVNAVGQLGRTPLHMAAASGYHNVAQMLVQNGADVDLTSGQQDLQQTPLLVACFYGHLGIVRLMLEKSPERSTATNAMGDSALHIATVQNKLEVVKFLLDKAGPGIAELLELRGFRGRTPLHAAAAWGRADIARVLLSKGANIRAKSGLKEECADTPLHLAAYYGHSEVAKVLIDADPASLELRNNNEETPLNRACFNGQLAVARLLLNRGALVNVRDKSNKTPLHYAQAKAADMAKQAQEAGGSGLTAIENPAAALVQLLLQNRQNSSFD